MNCGALSFTSSSRITSGTVVERPVPSISFASTVKVISKNNSSLTILMNKVDNDYEPGEVSLSREDLDPTIITPEIGSNWKDLA